MDEAKTRRAATVDCGALYARKRVELTTLVTSLSAPALEVRLAASPEWRVRDAFAHVVGITADLNAGNFGDRADRDAWTRTQVDARRARSIEEIAAEWERESPQFEDGLRLLGYGIGSHYVGDLHAHTQDVRAALGLAPDVDALTVLVSLDFYLDSLDEGLRAAETGALAIVAGAERHVVGGDEAVATLTADPFEVLRSLSGRRSLHQIRAMEWSGDADRLAPALSRYPLPETDIVD